MGGTAVREVVAIDRCDDNIIEAPLGNGLGSIEWLFWIRRWRARGSLHGTEAASACASVAEKHNGSSSAIPTLSNVRTLCLLAHL